MSKRTPTTDLLLSKRWRIKEKTQGQFTLFIDLPHLGYVPEGYQLNELKKEIIRAIQETNIYKHTWNKNEL